MKKIILLSTAAALLSPLAAKANQKSSILVGLRGSYEWVFNGSPANENDIVGKDFVDGLSKESFGAIGLEVAYTNKVWNNLQLGIGLSGLYGPESKLADDVAKKLKSIKDGKLPLSFIGEVRGTIGWSFPVTSSFELTPFAGIGAEITARKGITVENSTEHWRSQFKVPVYLGVRASYGYMYASFAGRMDTMTHDAMDGFDAKTSKANIRNWGLDASIGAEF